MLNAQELNELKEAIGILKRVYLLAQIPGSDGNDHVKIQESLKKVEDHIEGHTAAEAPQPDSPVSPAPVESEQPQPDNGSTPVPPVDVQPEQPAQPTPDTPVGA